jgi:hypothetical protein
LGWRLSLHRQCDTDAGYGAEKAAPENNFWLMIQSVHEDNLRAKAGV